MNINVTTKYFKKQIISELEKNKIKHIEEYKEAVSEYKKQLKQKIDEVLKSFSENEPPVIINNFNLSAPINNEKEYEKNINLFKRMIEDQIELDMNSANCIFNDDWDWLMFSKAINSSYTSKR